MLCFGEEIDPDSGRVLSVTQVVGLDDDASAETDDQTTTYVYGSSLSESEIARADLLRAVIYPDGDDTYTMTGTAPTLSDGDDATYDRVEYEYNRQGETVRTKDQNETVHEYLFDLLGRQTTDKVTAFGTNIDQTVQRISRTYEVRGMVASITSHDDPDVGEGNVLDEVVREYNDFGQLESISAPAPLSPSLGFR